MSKIFSGLFFLTLAAQAQNVLPTIIGGEHVGADDPVTRSTVRLNLGSGFCSGVIIEEDIILTAAHCVQSGGVNSIEFYKDVKVDTRNVKKYLNHADYVVVNGPHVTPTNDIGLAYFEGGLPEGFNKVVIADSLNIKEGDEVVTAGFGDGSAGGLLSKVTMKILNPNTGGKEFLIDQDETKGACYGDSGGPTYLVSQSGELSVLGVAAHFWDAPNCASDLAETMVSEFSGWIQEKIAELRKQD